MWGRIKVAKWWIGSKVKAMTNWLWSKIGWKGFVLIFCVMGITIAVLWIF